MALSTQITPGQFQISVLDSVSAGGILNDTTVILQARKPDGTLYDWTSATGATLYSSTAPTAGGQVVSGSHAFDTVSGNATQLTLKMLAANMSNLVEGYGSNSLLATIAVTDGSITVIGAIGNINVNFCP